jgi:hypothetical protein
MVRAACALGCRKILGDLRADQVRKILENSGRAAGSWSQRVSRAHKDKPIPEFDALVYLAEYGVTGQELLLIKPAFYSNASQILVQLSGKFFVA